MNIKCLSLSYRTIKKNREGDLMDSTFKFYKAQMNFVEEFERR